MGGNGNLDSESASSFLIWSSERDFLTLAQVGAFPQAFAYSRAQVLAFRFVSGIGTGIMSSIVPVYQSELCEARNRGMYVCSQPLAVGVGISAAYWFDYGMSFAPGSISWRLPIAFQVLFTIIVMILLVG